MNGRGWVGEQSIIGAAALLTEGLQVPPGLGWFTGRQPRWSARLSATERREDQGLGWKKYCRVGGEFT